MMNIIIILFILVFYNFTTFYNKIKTINNLINIIKNNKNANILFKNTPKYLMDHNIDMEGVNSQFHQF